MEDFESDEQEMRIQNINAILNENQEVIKLPLLNLTIIEGF